MVDCPGIRELPAPTDGSAHRIARWAHRAVVNVAISDRVSARAQTLTEAGFGALDAAYVACAEAAACDCLLTCDDRFMRRARRVQLAVQVQNPVEYLEEQIHVRYP
jgi:predicted nucleic acid-binding protein